MASRTPRPGTAALLLALFAGLAVAASGSVVAHLDRWVTAALQLLPGGLIDALNAVWVVGALPVTALALLVATPWLPAGRRAASWAAYAGVALCEAGLKHFVPTPQPHSLPVAPPAFAALVNAVNVPAGAMVRWLADTLAALVGHGLTPTAAHRALALRGSFPSGHVARLTLLAGLLPRRRSGAALAVVAAAAGIAVVATGGHWAWDVLGATALSLAALALVPAAGRKAPAPSGPRRRAGAGRIA